MATERPLRFRGRPTRVIGRANLLLFTTVHEEGQPTALYRLDVDKATLDAQALPCGAYDAVAEGDQLWLAGTDGRLYSAAFASGGATALGEPLSPAPKTLVLASNGRIAQLSGASVLVRGRADGRLLQTIELPEEGTAIASDASGAWIAVGTARGSLVVLDCEDKAQFLVSGSEKIHEGALTALLFELGELRVLSTAADNRLLSTHVRGKLEPEDRGGRSMHSAPVRALLFGPEEQGAERKLYSAGDDSELKAWPMGAKRRPSTTSDGVSQTLDATFVRLKDRPHIALAFANGNLRLLATDAAGKVGDVILTFSGAIDYAKAELASTDTKRREAALRTLVQDNDNPSIDLIANQATADSDHALRLLSAKLLGDSGNRRAYAPLGRLLRAPDEAVRLAALDGLRKLDGPSSLEPLRQALEANKADVGIAAIEALTELAKQDDQAYSRLLASLNIEPPEVRAAALSALEALHPADSPRASLAALRSNKGDLRRLALIRLLQRGLLSDTEVRSALRRSGEDADADVRRVSFLVSVLAQPTLAGALRYADKDVHRELWDLEVLGQPPDPERKPPKAAKVDPSALSEADWRPLIEAMSCRVLDTCLRGVGGLAALQDPRAFGTLLQLSRDKDTGARVAACRALARLEDDRAMDRLRLMIRDSATEVRDAAFTALAGLLEKDTLAAAEAGLSAEHEDVRRRGLQILIKDLRAKKPADPKSPLFDLLRRALNDAAQAVRSEAFKATLNLEINGGGAESLRFALASAHADIRREVLTEAMSQISQAWAWKLLLDLQTDPDATLRREAFDFAVKKSQGRPLEPLEAALRGPYADLRIEATRQLASKRTANARGLLVAALDDSDKSVRELSIAALITAEAVDALAVAMNSQHADVRVRAACARATWGDAAALAPLVSVIREPEPQEGDKSAWQSRVVAALGGLAELGDPSALDAVAALIASTYADIRLAAASALGPVSRPGKLDALYAALRHEDAAVRTRAALSLAFNGDPSGASIIFARPAPAPTGRNQRAAAPTNAIAPLQVLLAALGLGDAGQDALLALLDHSDVKLRQQALLAVLLLELASASPVPRRLLAALSAEAPEVRYAAATALERHGTTAFDDQVAATFNERAENVAAWTVPVETVAMLGAALGAAEPMLRVRAGRLLELQSEKEQEPFDRAWRLFSARFGAQLSSVERVAPVDAKARRELVFGAYVGLARQDGNREMIRIRVRSLSRLVAMVQEEAALLGSVEPVLVLAMGDKQAVVRLHAFQALSTLGVASSVIVGEALVSEHKDIGMAGLKLASEGGGSNSGELLRRVMLDREDGLHLSAFELLSEREGAVGIAVEALNGRGADLRELAVRALAQNYADAKAAAALRAALASRYQAVRVAAAHRLASLRDAAAFEPLVTLLASERSNEQREALRSLVSLGDPRTPSALLDRIVRDPTGTALGSELLNAVAQFRDPAVVERVLPMLAERKLNQDAFNALLVISGFDQDIADPDDESPRDWLKDQHPRHDVVLAQLIDANYARGDVRKLNQLVPEARWALGAQADAALAPLVATADADLRNAAIEAIGWRFRKRGGPVESLLATLASQDAMARFLAAEGLALNGRGEGLTALMASVDLMPELDIRRRAVVALGTLGDARALDLLLKLANEEGHALQEQAAEAIGQLGRGDRADAVFKVLARLAMLDNGVGEHALTGLRHFGTAAARALIRERSASESWSIRQQVAELLGYDTDPAAREILEKLVVSDSDSDVAEAAFGGLRRLCGPDSIEPDLAAVRSQHSGLSEDMLERIRQHATAAQLLAVLPKVHDWQREELVPPLIQALLNRTPLPVDAAAASLSSKDPAEVALAARVLGRAAGNAHAGPIDAAVASARQSWEKALSAERDGRSDDTPLSVWTDTLELLLWTAGRAGAAGAHAVALSGVSGTETEVLRIRRAALMALSSGLGGDAGRAALVSALTAADAEGRALAGSALHALAAAQVPGLIAGALGDPASLARLSTGASSEIGALRDGAARSATQGAALPMLVQRGDREGLAGFAADKSLASELRLGAVEALGRLKDPAVDDTLVALGKATEEDDELRKAAWRALRRARRVRARQEVRA